MILVDSSVWIDYLRGRDNWQTERLDLLMGSALIGIGDLNFTEVLQGCRLQSDFNEARQLLEKFQFIVLGDREVALCAAQHYRTLRALGVTIRGTLDVILATRCIVGGHLLLHNERDFDSFELHLGLQCVARDG